MKDNRQNIKNNIRKNIQPVNHSNNDEPMQSKESNNILDKIEEIIGFIIISYFVYQLLVFLFG